MNEWGDCDVKDQDWIRLERPNVIQNILIDNPAISSVAVGGLPEDEEEMSLVDWEAAGRCIMENTQIKHLKFVYFYGAFRSIDDARAFFRGLVQNRYIKTLEMWFGTVWEDDPDIMILLERLLENELFNDILMPFFQHNTNLESLQLDIEQFEQHDVAARNISTAIDACPSLKSNTFSCGDRDVDMEVVIRAICRKPGVQHIQIYHCMLSRSSCLAIRDMLSREDCELTSLRLGQVKFVIPQDAGILARGMADNRTLKYLSLSCNENAMSNFPGSARTSWDTIERLDLNIQWEANLSIESAVVLQQMPSLRTFRAINFRLNTSLWRDTLQTVLGPRPMLKELNLNSNSIRSDAMLQDLASCLASNNTLKKLNVGGNRDSNISSAGWWGFLSSCGLSNLEELSFSWLVKDDIVMRALCQYLGSNQHLRVLDICGNFSEVTLDGWGPFAFVLESHTGLEEIKIGGLRSTARGAAVLIANSLRVNASLRRLDLSICGQTELQAIVNILESDTCLWKDLELHYISEAPVRAESNEPTEVTRIITSALQRNSSLRSLQFYHSDEEFDLEWQPFAELLCDKSNIYATSQSNHIIEELVIGAFDSNLLPIEVYSMLQMNKNTNKRAVARAKIVQSHNIEEVNFMPNSLPEALSWLGSERSSTMFSNVYRVLRKVPHFIENKQKKRKAER